MPVTCEAVKTVVVVNEQRSFEFVRLLGGANECRMQLGYNDTIASKLSSYSAISIIIHQVRESIRSSYTLLRCIRTVRLHSH